MQAWMEGYESDIEYTAGYFREQEPDFLNLCAITHAVEPVDIENGFVYCELGCGQGMTALIMAANYPKGKFYAIDFNPSHIAKARKLAEQAGLENIVFLEKSFAEIVEDPSILPECDFITFHGIFAWISEENRQYLLDICKRHLKSGGMVYNSYNAKPGWSMGEPIQQLVLTSGKLFTGNSINRFDNAVSLIKELKEVGPAFFGVNKELFDKRLAILDSKNKHYLVHEYFNEGWRAFYFTEIVPYLTSAKLDFVGEASVTASYVEGLLPQKARALLAKIPDKSVRELYKDVMLNTMFRKDIYMRGVTNRLDANRQMELLKDTHWMLNKVIGKDNSSVFKFKMPVGEIDGKAEVYQPVVDYLAQKPATLAELHKATDTPLKELIQAILFLYHAGTVGVQHSAERNPAALRLNKVFADQLFITNGDVQVALPSKRSCLTLSMMDMLFYRATLMLGDSESTNRLVDYAARELISRDLKVRHNGIELTGNDMRNRLYELEGLWRKIILPVLRAGGAIA